ncbi:helix-turn-helix transcriptional regulator [Chitinophaga polysaccharea]|uniref:AraC family transcriptional regulator n=1 Tax=Chitinophaga polysaccharea TaxID=1293035 RepID=UPI001455A141|nr:AraC family transcriptional regulator [Chitinophaga polysaccharea]NLR58281.1 helix-turn-helix transcriptional regulator [Chitinophaga polysaccharea]
MESNTLVKNIPRSPMLGANGQPIHFDIWEVNGEHREYPAIFLKPHRKDYYFLVLVEEGSSRHWVDMQPYTLQPSRFYFSAPHQVHVKEQAKPMKGIILRFTDAFLARDETRSLKQLPIIQNLHNGHEISLDATAMRHIKDTMQHMVAEYHAQDTWHNSMLIAYLQVLLIFLSRLYNEQFQDAVQPGRELLKHFTALVEQHYRDLHEVAAYASLMNISAGHLGDTIREQAGKTAIAYIHDRVLLEARRLLFHTDHSIKEIAYELGFEDASYFNRFFKRLGGQTPLLYRNATRKMYH